MSTSDDFMTNWGFASDVKATLPGCTHYSIDPIPGLYRSGRARYEATFFNADRKVLTRRQAMELVSKRTSRPYFVVRRLTDWPAGGEHTLLGAPPSGPSRSIGGCGGSPTQRRGFSLDDAIA